MAIKVAAVCLYVLMISLLALQTNSQSIEVIDNGNLVFITNGSTRIGW